MIKNLIETWHGGFWDKAYVVLGCVMVISVIATIVLYMKKNPKKVLDFINDAYTNKRIAIGKVCCLSLHGTQKADSVHAEYVYYVNNKRYFVTYSTMVDCVREDNMEEVNADVLANSVKRSIILFYDEKDPSNVYTKMEAFTSNMAFQKLPTPKRNMWRSFDSTWETPIDLVKY